MLSTLPAYPQSYLIIYSASKQSSFCIFLDALEVSTAKTSTPAINFSA